MFLQMLPNCGMAVCLLVCQTHAFDNTLVPHKRAKIGGSEPAVRIGIACKLQRNYFRSRRLLLTHENDAYMIGQCCGAVNIIAVHVSSIYVMPI